MIVDVSRESQGTQTEGRELCPSKDDPGMVEVYRESQDTPIGGVSSVYPMTILMWSSVSGIPGYSNRGSELCPSQHDQGMVEVSRESPDTPIGGGKLCPSQDDPGMLKVSGESQDTGGWNVHLRMILGWSKYPGNPKILKTGGCLVCVVILKRGAGVCVW